MKIQHFYDEKTFTLTYVVFDEQTLDAIVIDPVLDYNAIGSKISEGSYKAVKTFIEEQKLNLHFVLETHAHADHLSGAQIFKRDFKNVQVAIGDKITLVQNTFKQALNLGENIKTDGSQFDRLLKDHEEFSAGSLTITALPTPGHTPACNSFLIGDAVFTGDALFMPDYGTGRCDFPQGDATALYQSVTNELYKLPDNTRVFTGHDYKPGGRELKFESTILESKQSNIQLKGETSESEFVSFRESRDATLNAPALLFPSIQVNIDAGHLPKQESNGGRYLKIPVQGKTDA